MCHSPWLIAAYHGLHRLCVPRHSPHAFFRLITNSLFNQTNYAQSLTNENKFYKNEIVIIVLIRIHTITTTLPLSNSDARSLRAGRKKSSCTTALDLTRVCHGCQPISWAAGMHFRYSRENDPVLERHLRVLASPLQPMPLFLTHELISQHSREAATHPEASLRGRMINLSARPALTQAQRLPKHFAVPCSDSTSCHPDQRADSSCFFPAPYSARVFRAAAVHERRAGPYQPSILRALRTWN